MHFVLDIFTFVNIPTKDEFDMLRSQLDMLAYASVRNKLYKVYMLAYASVRELDFAIFLILNIDILFPMNYT